MSSVPKYATYISEDKNFQIKIESADPSHGKITATYNAEYSPVGPISQSGVIGYYSWVKNDSKGKDGVAPFNIRITVSKRPESRDYCIYDNWTGAYCVDNTLLMEGVRSYVNSKGEVKVYSLGTLSFHS